MKNNKLVGIFGLLLTPFNENLQLDINTLKKNIRFMISNGIEKIVPCSSTGEFASLTLPEQKEIISITLKEAKDKAMVIPGVSNSSLLSTIDLVEYSKNNGADAVMVLPPYYYSNLNEKIVYQWYFALNKMNIDIIIYNNPTLTKYNIKPECVSELSKLKNIVGIKESHGNIMQLSKTIRLTNNNISVLEGAGDYQGLESLIAGASGFFSGIVNFLPNLILEMYENFLMNNIDKSKSIADKIGCFNDICSFKGAIKEIAFYKEASIYFGRMKSFFRIPILRVSDEEKKNLIKALIKLETFYNSLK